MSLHFKLNLKRFAKPNANACTRFAATSTRSAHTALACLMLIKTSFPAHFCILSSSPDGLFHLSHTNVFFLYNRSERKISFWWNLIKSNFIDVSVHCEMSGGCCVLIGRSLTAVVWADVEQWLVFEFGWAVTEHVIGSPQGDALHLQPADQLDQFTGTHKGITAQVPET